MKTKSKILFTLIMMIGVLLMLTWSCKKKDDNNNPASLNLLDNSFDSITTYPPPSKLTYTSKDGAVVTENVFPGQIVVLVSTTSYSTVTQLIKQNSGTVVAQIPNAGLYVATINTNSVNTFLSAMYQSSIVVDAFPNSVVVGRGIMNHFGNSSIEGDPNSIIQTIDVSANINCGQTYHEDAVGGISAVGGVSVQINDVTVDNANTDTASSAIHKMMEKLLKILHYANQHNLPVIINMSMGSSDDTKDGNYHFYKKFSYLLQAVEKQSPNVLDNAVIFLSGSDKSINETSSFKDLLQTDFPGSPIWDHLYFVESQEGANGCGLGYATIGTANVLSAPACNIPIPNTSCTGWGNSFSAPFIANLVAQTYNLILKSNEKVSVTEITAKLRAYQASNSGSLPSAAQLFSLCVGSGGFGTKYDGTWSGTFFYTAEVPQPSGPPSIINTSFTLSVTLVSLVSFPGYPQVLTVTKASCSDPTFGATSPVEPLALSLATLPETFGSTSLSGQGIMINFPNGSSIFTENMAGALIVSANGRSLSNVSIPGTEAFSAGTGDDSNLPGSGPGGYAYNWCTFTSWYLVR